MSDFFLEYSPSFAGSFLFFLNMKFRLHETIEPLQVRIINKAGRKTKKRANDERIKLGPDMIEKHEQ
jgi:hypothetical protein